MAERGQSSSDDARGGRSGRGSPTAGAGSSRGAAGATGASGAAAGRGGTSGGQSGPAPDLAEQGKEAVDQVQAQAGRLVDLAREQVTTQLTTQKERAAEGLGTLAGAIRQAGQQVRQQDNGTMVAEYVDGAADQVERLAATLREQEVDQLVESVGRFARRQPALFLAASFALGFAGTRFFKSSAQPQGRQPSPDYGYGYRSATGMSSRYGGDAYESGYRSATGLGMASTLGYGETGSGVAGSGLTGAGIDVGIGDDRTTRAGGGLGSEER